MPKRIAIQGISQGGYWVPRAVAFEKRIAAAIADPGVVDVSTSWTASLPKPMLELLKAGRKSEFDGYMAKIIRPGNQGLSKFPHAALRSCVLFRCLYGRHAIQPYRVAGQIRCPLLITEPVNEAYWPGQSRQLYDLVTSPKKLVHFSESDGADLHCEPKGTGIRDLRIFDWLDETSEVNLVAFQLFRSTADNLSDVKIPALGLDLIVRSAARSFRRRSDGDRDNDRARIWPAASQTWRN